MGRSWLINWRINIRCRIGKYPILCNLSVYNMNR